MHSDSSSTKGGSCGSCRGSSSAQLCVGGARNSSTSSVGSSCTGGACNNRSISSNSAGDVAVCWFDLSLVGSQNQEVCLGANSGPSGVLALITLCSAAWLLSGQVLVCALLKHLVSVCGLFSFVLLCTGWPGLQPGSCGCYHIGPHAMHAGCGSCYQDSCCVVGSCGTPAVVSGQLRTVGRGSAPGLTT